MAQKGRGKFTGGKERPDRGKGARGRRQEAGGRGSGAGAGRKVGGEKAQKKKEMS